MLRFLSFLIFLAGAAAAAVGAIAYFKIDVSDYLPAAQAPVGELAVDYGDAEPQAIEAPEPAAAPAPEPEPIVEEVIVEPITIEEPIAKSAKKSRSLARTVDPNLAEIVGEADPIVEFATEAAPAPLPTGPTPEEAFLESLRTVPIAHQTPREVEYMRPFDVVLAIDATGDDDATDSLSGTAVVVQDEAKVSDTVEVRLIGAKFEIEDSSPMRQKLSPVTENTWRWSVTPLTTGEHDLVFEIFAIDQDSVTPLRTFSDRVTVQVSGLNKAIAMANEANPIFVLLGGIGSALGGLWGTLKFFGKK